MARMQREKQKGKTVNHHHRYEENYVFADEGIIPKVFFIELYHIENSLEKDETKLNECHNNHSSTELVVFDHLIEGKFFANSHFLIKTKNIHQYCDLY